VSGLPGARRIRARPAELDRLAESDASVQPPAFGEDHGQRVAPGTQPPQSSGCVQLPVLVEDRVARAVSSAYVDPLAGVVIAAVGVQS
jgi:hypothetical protein